jgi:DNA-directed RNA polymerase subunit RPC12/RpoP
MNCRPHRAGHERCGLAEVLRVAFRVIKEKFKFSAHQWKVFNAILGCRTGSLGAHRYRCEDCGNKHFVLHSCRDRHCPRCQGAAAREWLEKQEEALIPIGYFHVVFTLPHQLNPLVRCNQAELLRLLFTAATSTLLDFGKNDLDAQLGVTAVVHTWGQTLCEHYHLHCIVTGGGLSTDESRWVKPRGNKPFLFHVRALSKVYGARFIEELCSLRSQGKLQFHGQCSELADEQNFDRLMAKLRRTKWCVFSKAPFGGPEQVLRYLSRYTHRVAIGDSRILRIDEQREEVTFSYKDYADSGKRCTMTLALDEFTRRFSLHILPPRFAKIRHYGILSTRNRKTKIPRCRELLADKQQIPTSNEKSDEPVEPNQIKCPHCGSVGSLVLLWETRKPIRVQSLGSRAPPISVQ